MGKGRILGGGSGGRYQVQVEYDQRRYKTQIENLNKINADILQAEADLKNQIVAETDPKFHFW